MTTTEPSTEMTPVDFFLAEQACLTAVERFSQRHDAGVLDGPVGGVMLDAKSRYYRDLVPLDQPAPGQQYGFEVDLDACTGCKACVTACHNLNDLDDGESFRTVGLLHGGTAVAPIQQSITTACHHCVDPACMNGCPTAAFEKDPVSGIVFHHEERCLGCGYCIWTCPYEVPRFNQTRGVIRKCDMCRDRLGAGEAPGCVSACPNGAITIKLVDVAALRSAAADSELLATAPPSDLTVPATTYRSHWGIPAEVLAADHYSVAPGHDHRPLAVMLVLTQAAIGAFCLSLVVASEPTRLAAFVLGLAGVAVSLGHLGHPERAWRALAGLRRSWLSREAVGLGAFVSLAGLALVTPMAGLGWLAAAAGLAGVASSAMLYVVTRRPFWHARLTIPKFALTMVAGGAATAVAVGAPPALGWLVALATGAELATQARVLAHLRSPQLSPLKRSALLLIGPLRRGLSARFATGAAGGIVLPVAVALGIGPIRAMAVVAWVLVLTGELIEDTQFFTAAAWTAMPGVLD